MPDEPAQEPRAPKGEPPGSDWAAYYRSTIGREPRPLFAKGMAAVDAAGLAPGQAIEIGFGDGRETLALLEAGWRVLAIDPAPAAAEVLQSQVPDPVAGRLEIRSVPAEDADLLPFDLLYAGYSLPFLGADAFDRFWNAARDRAASRRDPRRQLLRPARFMGRTGGYALHRRRWRAPARGRPRAPRARRGGPGRGFVPRPEALARLRRHRPATARHASSMNRPRAGASHWRRVPVARARLRSLRAWRALRRAAERARFRPSRAPLLRFDLPAGSIDGMKVSVSLPGEDVQFLTNTPGAGPRIAIGRDPSSRSPASHRGARRHVRSRMGRMERCGR